MTNFNLTINPPKALLKRRWCLFSFSIFLHDFNATWYFHIKLAKKSHVMWLLIVTRLHHYSSFQRHPSNPPASIIITHHDDDHLTERTTSVCHVTFKFQPCHRQTPAHHTAAAATVPMTGALPFLRDVFHDFDIASRDLMSHTVIEIKSNSTQLNASHHEYYINTLFSASSK